MCGRLVRWARCRRPTVFRAYCTRGSASVKSPHLIVDVVIPALDEALALPAVLDEMPRHLVRRIVVVDNGSIDGTGQVALSLGAELVCEERRGYGRACQAGLAHLAADPPEVVVFLDADHSDYPEDLALLLQPLINDAADLVCGSRVERAEEGALPPHVGWGNRLATGLIELLFDRAFRDLGPFRALRWEALEALEIRDPTFGWNVEMQVKALQRGLRVAEVSVRYRKRRGRSKISGTLNGTLRAGALILWTIFALRVALGRHARRVPATP